MFLRCETLGQSHVSLGSKADRNQSRGPCLLWVKRRHRPATGLGLLCPKEQTSATAEGMSAMDQKQTCRLFSAIS